MEGSSKSIQGQMTEKQKAEQPDLHFMPGGETSGFTSSGITSFQDINPVAIVRELLQNSLDAVRDTGRKTARIRFELTDNSLLKDIPGISSYRKAFKKTVESQENLAKNTTNEGLSDQAQSVANMIESCLNREKCETLYVLDDGIGLDPERMKGLLADGLSVKAGNSTGAVGNGHLTALPASDLRYVLYGGLYEENEMICAGHAVLASHEAVDGKRRMSKDGYFVSGLHYDVLRDPYIFPRNNDIPEYIRSKLDWIRDNWGAATGTVVAISAFNRFRLRKKKSLWDIVSKAAACSFFAAFAEEKLKIEVSEGGKTQVLDHTNIRDILVKFKDEQRTNSKFLSGARAYSAFETIKEGRSVTVSTDSGDLSMKVLQETEAADSRKMLTRIDLCRNGMWVTDQLPKLGSGKRFANLLSFHCVILLEAENGEIHNLVRKAEGPLHNELKARKCLGDAERKRLEAAMSQVAEKLQEIIPEYETEKYWVPDVLNVDVRGISKGGRRQRAGEIQQFSKIPRAPVRRERGQEDVEGGDEEGEGDRDGNGSNGEEEHNRGGGSFHKRGTPLPFDAKSSLTGVRSCIIEIIPQASASSTEVRFFMDENIDESCDDRSERQFVRIFDALLNGWPVLDANISHDKNGHPLGLRLGKLVQNKPVTLEFNFTLPERSYFPDDMPVALKTQLVKRTCSTQKKQGGKK